MAWWSAVPTSQRLPAAALAVSALVHTVVLVGIPKRIPAIDEQTAAVYSATLEAAVVPATTVAPAPVAQPSPPPRPRRARRKPAPPPTPQMPSAQLVAEGAPAEPPVVAEPPAVVAQAQPQPEAPQPEPAPPEPPPPEPELVALAQPAMPIPALEPPRFPVEALPPRVSVSYRITSAFADGHATYEWEREGDNYRITGEAEAEGFFTLFLEGQLRQESRGTVTEGGLRPERFSENRPNHPPEGLEFDWEGRKVTFDRGGNRNTTPLKVNTVDWLSMIFQLAHVPPSAETLEMQVFTQHKMYQFRLQVLGIEEIEIPLGRVRALHLRHDEPGDNREAIDVWLGVEQHYLPVKLRFPVARNRLMVEQVATSVTAR